MRGEAMKYKRIVFKVGTSSLTNPDGSLSRAKVKAITQQLATLHEEGHELIFEVPEEEVESLQSLVEEVMENAVSLSVPLKADSNIGNNWYEAK